MTPGTTAALLLAMSAAACATTGDGRSPSSIEGVYAYTAFEGARSFEGNLSIGSTDAGYGGFLAFGGTDLPLARAERDGSRITLTFESRERTVVLYLTGGSGELKGRWRSLRRAGAFQAVRTSMAWDGPLPESRRRRGSP